MARNWDVVVVGGGIAGLVAARDLAVRHAAGHDADVAGLQGQPLVGKREFRGAAQLEEDLGLEMIRHAFLRFIEPQQPRHPAAKLVLLQRFDLAAQRPAENFLGAASRAARKLNHWLGMAGHQKIKGGVGLILPFDSQVPGQIDAVFYENPSKSRIILPVGFSEPKSSLTTFFVEIILAT